MPRLLVRAACAALTTLWLNACGNSAAPAPRAEPAAGTEMTDLRKQRWARTCALCHVGGQGGAPAAGDHAAWSPRVAQGEDVLLEHTIDGFNNMPPLGYCMDCERDDLRAYIRFMAGTGT